LTVASCTPALVLSGGGARGAYQVGVLRQIARQHPEFSFPIITGVSAGAINAAFIASHREDLAEATEQLAQRWSTLSTSTVMRTDIPALLGNALRIAGTVVTGGARIAPPTRGLVNTKPLRRFLETLVKPQNIEANIRDGRLQALAVSATSYRTGDSVTFVQGPPDTAMWNRFRRRSHADRIGVDHVLASAAIPLFFPAWRVEGEYFGDGSLRQPYPLAPAVHLGADRVLAVSSRFINTPHVDDSEPGPYPSTARILGLMLNSIFLDQLDADAERLERVNQILQRVDPKQRWRLPEREVELLVLRPSRDIGRMAALYERKLPRALRHLVRGLGTRRGSGSDLLSYLLFVPEFLSDLIELGERDADLNRARISRFVEGCAPDGP
ncbi:MAG: patatin-like phospholipase family protein, partial [Gemmatimonadetes bacterium]|nr:patatin-like phospholipase family protein [Gemmatimonadota bacterium]